MSGPKATRRSLCVALLLTAGLWLPPAGAGRAEGPPVTLLAAGDIAYCQPSWGWRLLFWLIDRPHPQPGAVATARLLDRLPGTILALGDLAYPHGTTEQFRDCYGPTWGRHKDRTWPVPGNHEYYEGAAPYYAYWGPRAGQPEHGYYSFNLGAWHIVALNSNIDATAGSAQERWLRADLAASKARCILAFWHSPVFSSGKYGDLPEMLDAYRALYEAGASVVLAAHSHNYERLGPMDPDGRADLEGGIRNFVVGTGGARLRPNEMRPPRPNSEVLDASSWGLLEFTLHDDRYDWRFIPVEGHELQDSGSAACVRRR